MQDGLPNVLKTASVGVPRETKQAEGRVALTPSGVQRLAREGVKVLIEAGAGRESGFHDDAYRAAGATLVTQDEVWKAELIAKIKEPIGEELDRLTEAHVLFSYLHLAADRALTMRLVESGCTAIAYETVRDWQDRLPLLTPMSEIAGALAPQVAAECVCLHRGGPGLLLGGVPGVPPAVLTIIGAGTVGTSATRIGLGLGADVTVIDARADRLRELEAHFPSVKTLSVAEADAVGESMQRSDVIIGAALTAGAKAPRILQRPDLPGLKKGCLLLDVSIDQGGCFETSQPTTHSEPTYVLDGVAHYCVTNMPSMVARTATLALAPVTLPYIELLALLGLAGAARDAPGLLSGVNVFRGTITCRPVAEEFGLAFTDAERLTDNAPGKEH